MIDYTLSDKLKINYQTANPFPYIVIDNFLPEYLLNKCREEVMNHEIWYQDQYEWLQEYQQKKLYYPNEFTTMDEFKSKLPITTLVLDYLNSEEFLNFLRNLTGISDLYRDPVLMGGGIHRIKTGGKLDVHNDYDTHPTTGNLRKINLLIYLNKDWKSEWGGNLELWGKDLVARQVDIEPIFNRVVIFNIDNAPHGHPIPLNTPEGIDRYSLALYYFQEIKAEKGFQNKVVFYPDEYLGPKEQKNDTDLENLFK